MTTAAARHFRLTLGLALLSIVISVGVAAVGLKFKSDRSDLISPEADFHRRWLEYCERFRETNELLILIESQDPDQLIQSRNWLAEELRSRQSLYTNVMVHSSLEEWKERAASGVSEQMLQLQQQFQTAQMIQHMAAQGSPLQVFLQAVAGGLSQQSQQLTDAATSQNTTSPLSQLLDLKLLSRIAVSLEETLHAIDRSEVQPHFSGKLPVVETKGAAAYHRTDHGSQAQPAAEHNATAETLSDTQELISVVPLASGNSGEEKYRKNIVELERLLKIVHQRFPLAEIGVTGIPQLEYEEMQRSQFDMFTASIVSVVGVILLLLFGFRGYLLPLACCATLLSAMLWTLGFTTFAIGHLNILSMAFAAILAGLGIDFCIHLLSSFQDYRRLGHSSIDSLGLASDTVGKGIFTAAITTAVAFLCAGMTDFVGVAELGIIAGGGVMLSMVATFLIFPATVAWMGKAVDREALSGAELSGSWHPSRIFVCSGIREWIAKYPATVFLATLIPVVAISWHGWEWDEQGFRCAVKYDANLLNMQPENLPAAKTQEKLMAAHGGDVLYAVTWYNSREEAREQAERFRSLPSVGRVTELASQDLEGGQQQMEQALHFLGLAEQIAPPPPQSVPHNPAQIGLQLEQILEHLQHSHGIAEMQLQQQIDRFLDTFAAQPLEMQTRLLGLVEQALVRTLWSELRVNVSLLRQSLEEQQAIGKVLLSRFLNAQGDWLVQIHPKSDIWEDAPLANFVHEIRQVDEHVTGTPIQNFEASRQLKDSYLNAAIYAVLVIVLIVLWDMTNWKTTMKSWVFTVMLLGTLLAIRTVTTSTGWQEIQALQLAMSFVASVVLCSLLIEREECLVGLLSLLPSAVGTLVMLGTMSILGVPFTPANLVALPLVLGIGIDDGIHLIHDYRRSRGQYCLSANTWRALVLTSLTGVAGFGSLAIASHRGLAGLGIVVVIGVMTCLFVSLIMLPAILALISRSRKQQDEDNSRIAVHTLRLTPPAETDETPKRWAM